MKHFAENAGCGKKYETLIPPELLLVPQITEHVKKKHDPYDPGNPDTSLGQTLKCGGIKPC